MRTRASAAFSAVAGLFFFLGVPGVILLTIFQGGWWLFIPLGIVLIVTIALAEGAKRPAIEKPRSDT